MILPIKHNADWELICRRKQTQINKDNIHENRHRVDHDCKVADNVIITKYTAYKYETPCKVPFLIIQCFTNGTVELQYDVKNIR